MFWCKWIQIHALLLLWTQGWVWSVALSLFVLLVEVWEAFSPCHVQHSGWQHKIRCPVYSQTWFMEAPAPKSWPPLQEWLCYSFMSCLAFLPRLSAVLSVFLMDFVLFHCINRKPRSALSQNSWAASTRPLIRGIKGKNMDWLGFFSPFVLKDCLLPNIFMQLTDAICFHVCWRAGLCKRQDLCGINIVSPPARLGGFAATLVSASGKSCSRDPRTTNLPPWEGRNAFTVSGGVS